MTKKHQTKIKEKLNLSKLKLGTLFELTEGVKNSLSNTDLTTIYKHVLIDELNIGKIVLFKNSAGKWIQELCIGTESNSIDIEADLLNISEIQVLNFEGEENLAPFDVVVPIFHEFKPMAYLLLGDFEGEKIEISPIIKHLRFIQTLTNIVVVAIENKRLLKENIEQIRIKKEMELASDMQQMLFPKELPNNQRIEAASTYKPHHLVGGDYYDFIQLNNDEVAFCIADVSGKGVPAALLMSNFQASLRLLIQRTSSLSGLAIELNKSVLSNANGEKFITTFIGKYNLKTRNLQYINAGHNPPLLLVDHHFTPLTDGCTVLGVFDNLPSVTEKNITIPQNAILTCFTDGVVEQPNSQDDMFNLNYLKESILEKKEQSMRELTRNVIAKIEVFKEDVEYKDDIALLCLRLK